MLYIYHCIYTYIMIHNCMYIYNDIYKSFIYQYMKGWFVFIFAYCELLHNVYVFECLFLVIFG